MGLRRGAGWGFGAGWCRRPGFGRRYWGNWEGFPGDVPASREEEMAMLKADAEAMKKSLDAVQKRIEELGQGESSD
jgi:hypothetical protein